MKHEDFIREFAALEKDYKRFVFRMSGLGVGGAAVGGIIAGVFDLSERAVLAILLPFSLGVLALALVCRRSLIATQESFRCPQCHAHLFGYRGSHGRAILATGRCAQCGYAIIEDMANQSPQPAASHSEAGPG